MGSQVCCKRSANDNENEFNNEEAQIQSKDKIENSVRTQREEADNDEVDLCSVTLNQQSILFHENISGIQKPTISESNFMETNSPIKDKDRDSIANNKDGVLLVLKDQSEKGTKGGFVTRDINLLLPQSQSIANQGKKLPLQIVNESNENKDINDEATSDNEEDDGIPNVDTINTLAKTYKLDYSTQYKIDEDSKEYESSPDVSKIKRAEALKKTSKKATIKLSKKEMPNVVDPLTLWKNFKIKDILPEVKINSKSPDEIMFQGELFKLTSNSKQIINPTFSKLFSSKYLVFTKAELKYYKNMHAFMMMQKPYQSIPTFQVISIKRSNISLPIKGKILFFLTLQLLTNDVTKSNIKELDEMSNIGGGGFKNSKDDMSAKEKGSNANRSNVHSQTSTQGNKKNLEELCNEVLDNSSFNDSSNKADLSYGASKSKSIKLMNRHGKLKSQKMLRLDNLSPDNSREDDIKPTIMYQQYITNQNTNTTSSENTIVFASEKEDIINKWVFIIDYFSSKI